MTELVGAAKALSGIPGVVSVLLGPALMSDRAVVDSSFAIAILIVLESRAVLHRYPDHPQQKAVLDDVLKPRFERIVVNDFLAK